MVETCALCCHRFDRGASACVAGCPFEKGCNLVRCPRCGYEFPGETRTTRFLMRLLRVKDERPGAGPGAER